MLEKEKKFLDQTGLEYLWSKINMQDYPNNDTLVTIINAIDEGKMDKTTAIPLIEQAIAGQVPVVKSVDENGKPVEWETRNLAPELIVPIIAYPDFGILVSEVNFQQVDDFAIKNGLDNLRASFFIAGDTLETETEHYQPYYYSISCLKVRDIPAHQVIAYDFVFLMDDELKTYRLTSTGTILHNSIKLPLLKSAEVGQVLAVKEIDENGKPISWEAGKFIKTVNGKEPDGNGNIKVRTPYEVTLSYYEGLVTAFNRTPQQIIEAERSSDKEVIYKLYIPIVIEDSETGPDIYATEVELKNANENYNSYKGYKVVVNFGEKHAPIIIDGSTDSFYIDETWVAPTTPSDIPETTKPNQYLTTNENGEKVWENKPDIATLQFAIDTLNGTGEGSVRDTVADAVATIVANAPEDFDTLKEVADWISNDTLGTADLLQRMTTAEEKIVALDVQADWNQTDETAKDFIKNKPEAITDDEIDAICGGALTLDITESVLTDITTGVMYRIYVENGKLNMKEAEMTPNTTSTSITDINVEKLMLVDIATDTIHEVYVQDGKLHMTEVE